jgi:NADH dehydrogenase
MTSPSTDGASRRHRVVVVGGGFGGLHAVRALRGAPVEITLVDRRNYHLFQPLVYQVATGALSPGEIAVPLRHIFQRDRNVRVILGEVTRIDLHDRQLLYRPADSDHGGDRGTLAYDSLVVAAGSSYSYFGRDEWGTLAPSVKSIEDAIEVRRRILAAFEAAEIETDPARKQALLTFVVVGAGPTGVEFAGQLGELARDALPRDFRSIDTRAATILLVDQVDRVLPAFPPALSTRAARMLADIGVTSLLGHKVVAVDLDGLTLTDSADDSVHVSARTVLWAAGVHASELAATLADETHARIDRAGRVTVGPDLTLPAHPEVFVIGDMAQLCDASGAPVPLPGVAPVAIQQGRYAARVIANRLDGKQTAPFRYRDKGNLATIGRKRAVADIGGVHLSGLAAWLSWLVVHLFYLIGLQNRLLVFIRWTVSFVTRGRGARLILSGSAAAPEHPAAAAAPRPSTTATGSRAR